MKRTPSQTQGRETQLDLKCRQCGAMISHEKIREKVFQCEYCGASNVVPEKLWNYLHPSASPIESGGPPPEPFPVQDAYQPVPVAPGARKSNPAIVIVAAFTVLIIGAGVGFLMVLRPSASDSPSTAGPAEIVSESDIIPSMEKADPDRTMARIFDAVRKRWNPKALIGEVYISRLKADGTLDLRKGGGMISMEFFIPDMAAGLLPGVTEIKNAKCSVYVGGDIINPSVGDTNLYDIKSGRFASVLPACTIASLVKAAHKEGWPAVGFSTVSFPEVPSSIESNWDKMGLPSYVPGRKKDEDSGLTKAQEEKLASLLAQKGWLENAVYTYRYSVDGFDSGDLARLFSFKDCSPVDEWNYLPGFIDGLGVSEEAPAMSEAPPTITKVSAKDIQKVFKTHIPQLKKCFEKLRAADPTVGIVTLPVTVKIGPGGEVQSVSVEWKGIEDKAFRKCLPGSIITWPFPSSETSYSITYPIVFSGG
jgi:hypothetical protein